MTAGRVNVTVLVVAAAVIGAGALAPVLVGRWERVAAVVSPGPLSSAHAFLAADCAVCHTPFRSVDGLKCIACHASAESILGRQPTAFHAHITDCRGCHVEHAGKMHRPVQMDHDVLLRVARNVLLSSPGAGPVASETRAPLTASVSRAPNRNGSLDCNACHANQDRHRNLFGTDCAACHATTSWAIDSFMHPSPQSTDCAQCHQAPPSHYMEHFRMISERVAGVEHASVRQCYLCHQTTAWNDIKGVGWYKHH